MTSLRWKVNPGEKNCNDGQGEQLGSEESGGLAAKNAKGGGKFCKRKMGSERRQRHKIDRRADKYRAAEREQIGERCGGERGGRRERQEVADRFVGAVWEASTPLPLLPYPNCYHTRKVPSLPDYALPSSPSPSLCPEGEREEGERENERGDGWENSENGIEEEKKKKKVSSGRGAASCIEHKGSHIQLHPTQTNVPNPGKPRTIRAARSGMERSPKNTLHCPNSLTCSRAQFVRCSRAD